MGTAKDRVVGLFPEHAATIDALWRSSEAFRDAGADLDTVIEQLERSRGPEGEQDETLVCLKIKLAEEILEMLRSG